MASYLDKNGLSRLWDHITNKIDSKSVHHLVFDTKEHLDAWIDGTTRNLCPPFAAGTEASGNNFLTTKEDGTFNFEGTEPSQGHFGVGVSLQPGTYTVSCSDGIKNSDASNHVYISVSTDKGKDIGNVFPLSFTITEETIVHLFLWTDSAITLENQYVQIEAGDTATEYVPHIQYYTREDGITKSDLKAGDFLLVEESGVADYWWDGTKIVEIEATADKFQSLTHDTESNWSTSDLVPKKGQIVVYDVDDTHDIERFKIGDGVNTVNNLPFRSIDGGYESYKTLITTTISASSEASTPTTTTTDEFNIIVGDYYKVTVNGTIYDNLIGKTGEYYTYIGNGSYANGDGENTGESFIIYNNYGGSSTIIWFPYSDKITSWNIKVEHKEAIRIPNKYIGTNNLVFDTYDNLKYFCNEWINLCPIPAPIQNSDITLTLVDDKGGFKITSLSSTNLPYPIIKVVLDPGTYTIASMSKSPFYYRTSTSTDWTEFGNTAGWNNGPVTFSITSTSLITIGANGATVGDDTHNIGISKGSYIDNSLIMNSPRTPYTREDGITEKDLKPGDLLISETTTKRSPDMFWDGSSNKKLKAYAVDIDLDLVYPVNSVYMSVNNINPATLFGGGTWERITSSITDVYMWKRTA